MVKAQGNNKNTSVKATSVYASPNVNAKPVVNNLSVNGVNDLSKYYSELSKDYAEQAKSSAENVADTLEDIKEAEATALSNISMLGNSVSDSIVEGITHIGETTEQALNDLETASNEVKNEILAEIQEQANIVDGYAEQAEQSAIIATTQANASANQATIATAQANIATEKVLEASTMADNALSSATSASNSATLANESANASKTSETNAKTSETNAQASANTATAQATIATQQANIAKQEVAKLANVYRFKGSVATYADLPTNANVGDVYDIQENGSNYAWTGSEWDSLGGVFKTTTEWGGLQGTLSNQTDLQNALDEKQDTISDLTTIRNGASLGATAVQPNDLATVATSGSYNDLTNKPTIPTVNDATLTIQKNGTTLGTFTANQSTNETINILADSVDVDGVTVSKNTDDELQAIGVIDSSDSTTAIKTWTGTKAEYDAITTKDANTLYNITDDTDVTLSLLELLYPVGSIYIGTMNSCPLQVLGVGTWQLIASDRVLQGAGVNSVGSIVEAGLPNITGELSLYVPETGDFAGALYTNGNNANEGTKDGEQISKAPSTGSTNGEKFYFDASRSNPIYKDGSTVQPPAYIVNIWERIS